MRLTLLSQDRNGTEAGYENEDRAYAATGMAEKPGALYQLGVFERFYHRVASQSWPARISRILSFTAKRRYHDPLTLNT